MANDGVDDLDAVGSSNTAEMARQCHTSEGQRPIQLPCRLLLIWQSFSFAVCFLFSLGHVTRYMTPPGYVPHS